jgi:hypothetical protein
MKVTTLLLRKEKEDIGFKVEWDGNNTLEFLVEKLYKYDGVAEDVEKDLKETGFKYYKFEKVVNKR